MKKNLTVLLAALLIGGTAFGQAVSDRNIIPVAVNLNQVLRMTITNGGNIEFVFNTIDQYKDGISGAAGLSAEMYQTDFTVSSSTRWALTYGSESATFLGVDDPTHTLALDNVGFFIEESGVHNFLTLAATEELVSAPTVNATEVTALQAYPIVLISDAANASNANAGDASDNSFTLVWRCGTIEGTATPMNANALIDQSPSPAPDRYVANVLFELSAL